MKKKRKTFEKSSSPEKISAEESLERMKQFAARKEKVIASIVKSEN
jgi:hypothetical protein